MNKTFLIALSALLALTFATGTFAQGWKLAAEIPFDFTVGDVKMPSGRYTVQLSAGQTLLIKSSDDHNAVISFSNEMMPPRNLKQGRLVFNAYGDRYFLSTVSWPQGPARMVPPSKFELRIAKEHADGKVEVATQ
jgi:hypothetical protein